MAGYNYLSSALESYLIQTQINPSGYYTNTRPTNSTNITVLPINSYYRPTYEECNRDAQRVNPSGSTAYADSVYNSYGNSVPAFTTDPFYTPLW